MKRLIITGIVLLAGISGQAAADCISNRISGGNNLLTLLSGNTVCGQRGSGATQEQWQEEHLSGGQLWDFKRGTSDPVDPRKQVGTWSASNGANAAVTYSYTGGAGPYTYQVYRVGAVGSNRYSFCTGSTEVVQIRLQTGTGSACASF